MTAQQDIRADSWTVAGRTFTSRLIVGTGKYKSYEANAAALAASGAEIVTVAVRRVNISDPGQPLLTVDPYRYGVVLDHRDAVAFALAVGASYRGAPCRRHL